jgi:hypothetical protein
VMAIPAAIITATKVVSRFMSDSVAQPLSCLH